MRRIIPFRRADFMQSPGAKEVGGGRANDCGLGGRCAAAAGRLATVHLVHLVRSVHPGREGGGSRPQVRMASSMAEKRATRSAFSGRSEMLTFSAPS